jgi:hypothetical protein
MHSALTALMADFGEGARLGIPDRLLADVCMDALDSNRAILRELSRLRRAAGLDHYTHQLPKLSGG